MLERRFDDLDVPNLALARYQPDLAALAYLDARRRAAAEAGLPIATFPETPTPDFERATARAFSGEDFEI